MHLNNRISTIQSNLKFFEAMSMKTNEAVVNAAGLLAGTGLVAVIGAGQMGNGIAHVFAQTGYRVVLIDVNAEQLEKAVTTITKNLDRQVAKGTLT